MIEKEEIIKAFITNFVLKDKAERARLLLTHSSKRNKFTDLLNHRWDAILNMKRLVRISKSDDNKEAIQRLLKFNDNEPCYIISNYGDYDDKIFAFKEVFTKIYSKGVGSILINIAGDTLFLDTEQVYGPAERYIGKMCGRVDL